MIFSFVCYISLCIILLCMFQFTRYVDHSSFRLFAYILYTHHVLYIHVPQSLYASAPLYGARRQWSVRTCFCECEQNAFFSGITLFIWNISLLCNSVGQWSFTVLQKKKWCF